MNNNYNKKIRNNCLYKSNKNLGWPIYQYDDNGQIIEVKYQNYEEYGIANNIITKYENTEYYISPLFSEALNSLFSHEYIKTVNFSPEIVHDITYGKIEIEFLDFEIKLLYYINNAICSFNDEINFINTEEIVSFIHENTNENMKIELKLLGSIEKYIELLISDFLKEYFTNITNENLMIYINEIISKKNKLYEIYNKQQNQDNKVINNYNGILYRNIYYFQGITHNVIQNEICHNIDTMELDGFYNTENYLIFKESGVLYGNIFIQLTGSKEGDYNQADKIANDIGLFTGGRPEGYVWHHVYMGWINFSDLLYDIDYILNSFNGNSYQYISESVLRLELNGLSTEVIKIIINNRLNQLNNILYTYDPNNDTLEFFTPIKDIALMQLVLEDVHEFSKPHLGSDEQYRQCRSGSYPDSDDIDDI